MENDNQLEPKVDNHVKELVMFKRQKRHMWNIRTQLLRFWIVLNVLLFGLIITLILLYSLPVLTNTSGRVERYLFNGSEF